MTDTRTAPYAALLLRLALGLMFVAHGLTKLLVFTPAGTAKFFESVGFAGWFAWPIIAFEIVGGVLLLTGVYARAIAAVAAIEPFMASTVHFRARGPARRWIPIDSMSLRELPKLARRPDPI